MGNLRVRGENTGSALWSHPCAGEVTDGEGQVRSRDEDSYDWGNETQTVYIAMDDSRPALMGRWEDDHHLSAPLYVFVLNPSLTQALNP